MVMLVGEIGLKLELKIGVFLELTEAHEILSKRKALTVEKVSAFLFAF